MTYSAASTSILRKPSSSCSAAHNHGPETCSIFQQAMQGRLIEAVERLSGRRVLAFISNQHVGPDLEIELFVLAPGGDVASTDGIDAA